MDKEKLITEINNLAVDFWTMNLHNGTFESHLRNLLNEYEQAVNFAHSCTQLPCRESMDLEFKTLTEIAQNSGLPIDNRSLKKGFDYCYNIIKKLQEK